MELWKIIPPEEGNDFCHRLVEHGRDVCTARTNPHCDRCVLNDICAAGKKLMESRAENKVIDIGVAVAAVKKFKEKL